MQIIKSTRHSKIAGDFGEALVLYWLSKDGFECAKLDHTGIDLIAVNRHTGERMGISVKSRTRSSGREDSDLSIHEDQFQKIDDACKAFGLQPYFAIVVDAGGIIRVFIVSKEHLLELCPRSASGSGWKMTEKHLAKYYNHPGVIAFELSAKARRWWNDKVPHE